MQADRWVLWLAPGLIAGAAAWLSWPRDPPLWFGAVCFAGAGACSAVLFRSALAPVRALAGALALTAAAGLGAAAAQWRSLAVAAPVYSGGETPVLVEGWVLANEASENGPRLRLLVHAIAGEQNPPRVVRVAVADAGVLTSGRAARCRAVLGPPAPPLLPGSYDFARRAYFEGLGATGFAFGRCRPIELPPPRDFRDRAALALGAVRSDLSAAIVAAAPGRGGALAAALVTGDRSPIDPQTTEALQNSGLGHLVSVSGIHMGVVGGLAFALLLWCFSLVAPIALRFPVKKIAAVGALILLAAYLLISGASVPALRAFVMACVAFEAILLDRPAISIRGLALAVLIVVLLFPESVLEPGFQMSFAATAALVALFEMLRRAPSAPALPTPGPLVGALNWATRGIGSVLLISLVAGLATDPFALYHFQRFSLYALPANLIAAPIMSFLVAPAAAVAAILAPFGLADPALEVMASALDLIVAVGAVFGERPEAVRALPRPDDVAFVLCVLALLWGCLWRGALRWGALLLLAASAAVYLAQPHPVAAFDADLRAVFVRSEAGWAMASKPRRSTYTTERIGAMLGVAPLRLERMIAACAEQGCQLRTPAGRLIALARTAEEASEACGRADLILAWSHGEGCAETPRIDPQSLSRTGGGLVYEDASGLRIVRSHNPNVSRPWSAAFRADAVQE
jgi:competence protein ComEC